MKVEKIFKIIYIALFTVICTLPLCLWGFFENNEAIGKKELAEFPSVQDENNNINAKFFSEFDDYFTEHLVFRPQLVSCDNYIKSQIFSGDAGNVVVGKNGYIFSQETISDYTGKTFTQRKINNIAQTIRIMQDKVLNSGNNFVFTVAPNKNTIYPNYMPSRYIKGENSNLSMLKTEIEKRNINYTDLEFVLKSADGEMYLKRDTHWNNIGALYGFNAIMSSLGKECKDYNGISYDKKKTWRGDLDKLLYPSGGILDYQYYFNNSYDDIKILLPRLNGDNNTIMSELMGDSEKNDSLIKSMNTKANGQLLMLRDSFARAMLPYLLDNYKSVTLTRSQPFSLTSLSENSNTDVVYEIVERNLGKIVEEAPVMGADECEKPIFNKEESSKDNIIKVDRTDSFIKIYGMADKKYFEDDSRVFILLSNSNNEICYEAFPICETELLKLDTESDYGYSALIQPSSLEKTNYSVSLIVTNSNGNISTGIIGNVNV